MRWAPDLRGPARSLAAKGPLPVLMIETAQAGGSRE